ncbi:MAG: hypothetical protein K0S70_662 [Microbacterium sp.]|nr:hypothetical protein [Microbacterium sp.]
MELEVIGRIRAIIRPDSQPQRVKAYVAARAYDLGELEKMTGVAAPYLPTLQALVPALESLEGEPDVFRDPRASEAPLERWRLRPGAAARWLHGR